MEKILSKKIKEIINSCDETIYISNIKCSLYFISKLIYLNRFICKSKFEDFLQNYSKNMELFDENSVVLFKEYSEFNFFDKSYDILLINLLKDFTKNIDISALNISKLYENLISDKERKVLGQVYTPDDVIEDMIKLVFENTKVSLNT